MKDTSNYRTKTNFIERKSPRVNSVWEIAIDIGYSGVKLFAPNAVARFPSYAKRVDADFAYAGDTPKNSILYKDLETGEFWVVGEKAQDIMSMTDTSDSEASLYGRERYRNPMFRVVARVGLGLGMRTNQFGGPNGEPFVIQTGLPERYMTDADDLKDALSGGHNFALKIGAGQWENFNFVLEANNIYVISQPRGTLFSVCINSEGRFIADAGKYLSSSVIVFDPGFGTLDIFPISSGVVGRGETYNDLGMKRILQETVRAIRESYGVNVSVPAMQKYLSTGTVRYVNNKTFESREYEFGDMLAAATKQICDEAIRRMTTAINLGEYNYMIVTGGTGAAWFNTIKDIFKDFTTLTIIQGNQNDDLPFVYSNARGYYFYRYNRLIADKK